MPRVSRRAPGLGQSLINDRFGSKLKAHQYVHAAELPDEGNKVETIQSVTELSSLDDFLVTAEMAGTEFTAERQNIHFVESNQKGQRCVSLRQVRTHALSTFVFLCTPPTCTL